MGKSQLTDNYPKLVSRGDCYSWSLKMASKSLVSAPLGLEVSFFSSTYQNCNKTHLFETSLSQIDLEFPNTRDSGNTPVPHFIPKLSTP